MFQASKHLGLAVTETGVTLVEVALAAGRPGRIGQTLEIPFSAELNLEDSQKLGARLKSLLRGSAASARCTIGLASCWLAGKEKSLPATDDESLRGVLAIAAEREFASGPQELMFDYLPTAQGKNVSVLLLASRRKIVEQTQAMAHAAGLTVSAVTSSADVLARATTGPIIATGRMVLLLTEGGADLVVQSPKTISTIRHLPSVDDSEQALSALAGELRRILMQIAPGEGKAEPRTLAIWNAQGLSAASLESLGRALGSPVRNCHAPTDLGLAVKGADSVDVRFAAAAALAATAGKPELDFLHSRMEPKRQRRLGKWARWGVAAGVLLAALGAYVAWDYHATQQEVAALQERIDATRDQAKAGKELLGRVSFAQPWYDRRSPYLDWMTEITNAFPQEGRIYATRLEMDDRLLVTLKGRSSTPEAAVDLVDRLKADPNLSDVVQHNNIEGDAGQASQDASFLVTLKTRGVK